MYARTIYNSMQTLKNIEFQEFFFIDCQKKCNSSGFFVFSLTRCKLFTINEKTPMKTIRKCNDYNTMFD